MDGCIISHFTGLKMVDKRDWTCRNMDVETGRRDVLVRYYSFFYNLTVNADTFCKGM